MGMCLLRDFLYLPTMGQKQFLPNRRKKEKRCNLQRLQRFLKNYFIFVDAFTRPFSQFLQLPLSLRLQSAISYRSCCQAARQAAASVLTSRRYHPEKNWSTDI